MSYDELLKRAKDNLPKINNTDRFDPPSAIVNQIGRQTVIKNFSEIAKALRRSPEHLSHFLFKELAVPGSIRNNELVLQGKIGGMMINQRVKEYIRDFVLCKECKKADTTIKRSGNIDFIKCEVCGASRAVKHI